MNDQTSTRSLVHTAAIELMSTGETPTPKKIRDMIGRGSNTTIAEELSAFFSESSMLLNPEHEIPMELGRQLRDFWKMAIDLAQQHHSTEVKHFEEYKAQAIDALNRSKALNAEKDDLLDAITAKYAQCQSDLLTAHDLNGSLSQECRQLTTERDAVANDLKATTGEVARLNAYIDTLKAASAEQAADLTRKIEVHRTELKEAVAAHALTSQAYEKSLATSQAKCEQLTVQTADLRDELAQAKYAAHLESQTQQKQIAELNAEKNALRREMDVTKHALSESKRSADKAFERLSDLTIQHEKALTDYHIALGRNQSLQEQVVLLNGLLSNLSNLPPDGTKNTTNDT